MEKGVYNGNKLESFDLQIIGKGPAILFATHRDDELFFLKNMIPRFKKALKITDIYLKKEEFLEEHNRLSPESLRATLPLLSRFKEEKALLFQDDNWSIDKFRRPFILWLTSTTLDNR